jgi:hypothetical protein
MFNVDASTGAVSPPWSATTTTQTNKHKSGDPNDDLALFGPPKVCFYSLVLAFTNYLFSFVGFCILIMTPLPIHQMTHADKTCTAAASLCSQGGNGYSHFQTATATNGSQGQWLMPRHSTSNLPTSHCL